MLKLLYDFTNLVNDLLGFQIFMHFTPKSLVFINFLYTKYAQKGIHFVLQPFNKLTIDTFLKHFFFKFTCNFYAKKSRLNGTEVEF